MGAQRPGKTGENWVATQKSQNRKWPSERFSLLHLLRRFLGCLSAPADLVLASFFRFLKDFTLCMHIQASPPRRRYAAEAPRGRRGRGSRINFRRNHDSHRSYDLSISSLRWAAAHAAQLSRLSRTRTKASPARPATRWRLKSRKIASGLQDNFRVRLRGDISHPARLYNSHPHLRARNETTRSA